MEEIVFNILFENLCERISQEKLAKKYGYDPRFDSQGKISDCIIENGFGTGVKGFQAANHRRHLVGISREEFRFLIQGYQGSKDKNLGDFIAHTERQRAAGQQTSSRPYDARHMGQQQFSDFDNPSGDYGQNKPRFEGVDGSSGGLFMAIGALVVLFILFKTFSPRLTIGLPSLSNPFKSDVSLASFSTDNGGFIGEVNSKNKSTGYGVEYINKDNFYLGKFEKSQRVGEGIEKNGEDYFAMGAHKKGKLDGLGIINESETLYIGDMKKGRMDGYIVEISPDNNIYINKYKRGKKKDTILSFDRSSINISYLDSKNPYERLSSSRGFILETKKKTATKSIEIGPNYIFVGTVKKGENKGLGIRILDNNIITYGEWKGDKIKNGINLHGGNIFFGDYTDALKNGKGMEYILTEPIDSTPILNGDIYIGYFKDGMRHGKGRYVFNNGNIVPTSYRNNIIED